MKRRDFNRAMVREFNMSPRQIIEAEEKLREEGIRKFGEMLKHLRKGEGK